MANTKGKIIIGVGIVAVGGIGGSIIYSAIRKNRIKKKIYAVLNDTKTVEGQQSTLSADDKHKAHFGFDPNFWKNGKNGIMPDTNLLFRPMDAREHARKIYDAIWRYELGLMEDEEKAMNEIKKLESQGQLSQVTHAYANALLGDGRDNGDLAEDLKTAFKSTWYGSDDYLVAMNKHIDNLPY